MAEVIAGSGLEIKQDSPPSGPVEFSTNVTGWGSYSDTLYTEGSPLTLSAGVKVDLTNNAGSSIESQLPTGITTLYNGSTITGFDGDGQLLTISFRVKQTSNQATRVTVVPDIGGAVGEIDDFRRDQSFNRGINVEQGYLSSFGVYNGATWEANGATLKIESDEPCEIYNIRFLIHRIHKAK